MCGKCFLSCALLSKALMISLQFAGAKLIPIFFGEYFANSQEHCRLGWPFNTDNHTTSNAVCDSCCCVVAMFLLHILVVVFEGVDGAL